MKLFGIDITPYEKVIKQFLGTKLKDYGLIPTDLMATYAAVDVLSCRYIHRNIKIHSECSRVLEMEHSLLPLLIQLEQVGLHVDFNQLIKDWHEINLSQLERIRKIKALAGLDVFDPSKKKSLKELFCDKLGWELNWTDKSYEKFLNTGDESDLAESYSKESILKHRKENPELVDTWRDYQRDEKLRDSFIIPYLEQHIDDNWLIHCSFNQIVRTGRMSCRTPNMQQLSKRAKTFVLPYTEDYVLVEFDLSQIEFRLLVHYINNIPGIKAFNENPKTDYHQWIGDECSVVRDIAKRVNFGTGYGAGKARVCEILSNEQSFLNSLNGELAEVRASNIVDKYYATLPELKPTPACPRCLDFQHQKGESRRISTTN
jgi:DNA polymerase I-like protein with 3'-5' exonuclease and polymerase domains